MIRRPPRSTQSRSSAASDVYKRQDLMTMTTASPRARHNGRVDESDPAARPRRRSFTAEYKAAIVDEYDQFPAGDAAGAGPASAPPVAAQHADRGGTPAGVDAAALRRILRSGARAGVGLPARRRGVSVLDLHDVPAVAHRRGEPRAAPSAHPPGQEETRADRTATQRGLQLGYHQAARSRTWRVLRAVRDHRYLLALRRGLDSR